MKRKKNYRQDLLPPPDPCLPYEEYVEKHGDPKKNKHQVRRVNGRKIVIIPAEKGTVWHLQRAWGDTLEKQDVLHSEASDDEVGSDDAEQKFEDLKDDMESSYAKAAVGETINQLMKKVQSEVQPAADAGRSPASKKRGGAKSMGSGSGFKSKGKAFGIHSSSDEEPGRVGKRGAGGGNRGTSGGRSGGAARSAGAASGGGGGGGCGGGSSNHKLGGGGGGGGSKGRPQKDLHTLVAELLMEFRGAKEASLFFGEQRNVQLKSVRRHIVTASQRLTSCTQDQMDGYEQLKNSCSSWRHASSSLMLGVKRKARRLGFLSSTKHGTLSCCRLRVSQRLPWNATLSGRCIWRSAP